MEKRKLWITYSCFGGEDVTSTHSTKTCTDPPSPSPTPPAPSSFRCDVVRLKLDFTKTKTKKHWCTTDNKQKDGNPKYKFSDRRRGSNWHLGTLRRLCTPQVHRRFSKDKFLLDNFYILSRDNFYQEITFSPDNFYQKITFITR